MFSRIFQFGTIFTVFALGCGTRDPTIDEIVRSQENAVKRREEKSPPNSQEQLETASREFSSGNLSKADAITRQLLIAEPRNSDVILLAAQIEAARGDKIAAAALLESTPVAPEIKWQNAMKQAAAWLDDGGQKERAIELLENAVQLRNSKRLHHELARLLNQSGRRIEAAKSLRLLASAGDIREKELLAMITYGNPFIDGQIASNKNSSSLRLSTLAEAKVLRELDQITESLSLTQRLSQQFPNSTQVSAFLGRLYSDLQDEESLAAWILQTPPDIEREPEYWNAVGGFFQRQGKHDVAVRCFGEAVARDETDRFSYLAMSQSLRICGEADSAQRVLQRFEWIDDTAHLARKFNDATGTKAQLLIMADLMDALKRPFEAKAWRKLAERTKDESSAKVVLLHRQPETDIDDRSRPELWQTCGLDLSNWPLPSSQLLEANMRRPGLKTPPASPVDVAIRLEDIASKVGLKFQYFNGTESIDSKASIHQVSGGGIGVIDFDLDGWPDIYFTQGGRLNMASPASEPNQLFRNMASRAFLNVTEESATGDCGYGQGVAVADINQDGFPDLVIANIGRNALYVNQGDGTFSRKPLPSRGETGDWTTSIACGDISGDQLPEIVEVKYIDDPTAFQVRCGIDNARCNPANFRPAAIHILTVDPDGQMNAWDQTRYENILGHGFAAVIGNFDREQGNDIFVVNDTDRNHYWKSQPSGTQGHGFTLVEAAEVHGCATGLRGNRQGSMGIAYGDFDRNGLLDFHVTNYANQPSDLYMQQSGQNFVNETMAFGVGEPSVPMVGWGTQAVDFDRDGWLDLAVLNGHVFDHSARGTPYQMPPQLFRGGPNRFELISSGAETDSYWARPTLGRTLAMLDWNRDGRPDLIASQLDRPVSLLENQTESRNWIQLELIGTTSERDAIGAEVKVIADEELWTNWNVGGDGFQCSNEAVVDFGIGEHDTVHEIQINWPSGLSQRFKDLQANVRYLIVEGVDGILVRFTTH